jgi:signal transduction histidine kinase
MTQATLMPACTAPWMRVLLLLLLLLACTCCVLCSANATERLPAQPAAQPAAQRQLTLTQARVSHDGGASWLDVALPDHWPQRGAKNLGKARYELRFEQAAQAREPLALAFSRISMHRSISVNGTLVSQRGDGPGYTNRRASGPALVELPPSLLRPGSNVVQLDVQHYANGVLSAPLLGPVDAVRGAYAVDEFIRVGLPEMLNLASLGLALFMLTVWLKRRSEVALGSFAGLALLTGLRNLAYFTEVVVVPPGLLDWFFYSSQVFSAVLLGTFARATAGHANRGYGRLLTGMAVVLPLVAAGLAVLDDINLAQRIASGSGASYMNELRRWTYPLVALAVMPAVGLMLQAARQRPGRSLPLVALGVGALLLGGMHDYALQIGRPLLVSMYVLPYAFPLVLGAVSVFLVARMVAATGAAEALATELDQRVALRTQQLSQANAARARFLSAASHDLRQPALTIGLLVSLLRDQTSHPATAANEAQRRLIDKLHAAAASLDRLLNGLLDLSRLDPLTVRARSQPVALQPLLQAIAQDVQAEAEAKGLRLRWRATPLAVQADPVLLEQVLRNLVGNALRYTERGGVLLAARRLRSGGVRLLVCDTGIGIAAADQQRVFEEFVQLGNPGRDRNLGQGLGLAIAQRSAVAMGTQISLRSVPGRGSSFSISLPALQAQDAEVTVLPATGALPLQDLLIWLLDDDEALREAMTLRLQTWGAQVRELHSVAALRQALEHATAAGTTNTAPRPALLMTDQRLPDGSGALAVALTRQAFGAGLPCLLLTGDPDAELSLQLQQQGVPLLVKPVAAPELLQAVEIAAQPAAQQSVQQA